MRGGAPQGRVLRYFLATYLFSWAFWIPSAILFRDADSIGQLVRSPLFIALQTLGAAGPSVVALAMLRLQNRQGEIQAIFSRYKRWRFAGRWYFVSVALFPLLSLLALVLHTAFVGPVPGDHPLMDLYGNLGLAAVLVLPLIFLGQMFSSPLLEEFGWRGYAQPLLQKRFGVPAASAVVGVAWGLWHLPLALVYGMNLPLQMVLFVTLSLWIGAVYNATGGSMMSVLLFHASLNVGLNVLAPTQDSWILAVLVAAVTGLAAGFTDPLETTAFDVQVDGGAARSTE